jgi:hypothetical protein
MKLENFRLKVLVPAAITTMLILSAGCSMNHDSGTNGTGTNGTGTSGTMGSTGSTGTMGGSGMTGSTGTQG